MSVLANQTNATPNDALFLANTNNINVISSLNLYNGSLNISQINLDAIQMDCAYLNSTPTLLLNGVPVAATSSFASSITAWASYPALNTITYAAGGGIANLAVINALSNVSTASMIAGNGTVAQNMTVSTLNGAPYPNNANPALIGSTDTMSGADIVITKNFTGLDTGLYMLQVTLQGQSDPMSCSAMIRYSGGLANGGSYHQPVLSGQTNTNNYVSIQSDIVGDPNIQVYVHSTTFPNSVVQVVAYRIY